MPRAFWSGSISFGLVYIPVRLFGAVSHKEVHFHEVHAKDGARINERRFCSREGIEVPYDQVAKGYQLTSRKTVLITPAQLEAADPKTSRLINIEDFVALRDIDPIYFLNTYYVVPEPAARKAYVLLLRAMERSKKVAIARVVMRQKQYLTCLRPVSTALLMSTMLYLDEIVPEGRVPGLLAKTAKPSAKEMRTAERLIESLSSDFKPGKYKDTHRAKILALIKRKARGKTITPPAAAPQRSTRVADLLAQLEASVTKKR